MTRRAAVLPLLLASLALPVAAPSAAGPRVVDDTIVLRAAKGRALPRRLSPARQAVIERVVDHLRRGEIVRALEDFDGFARSYFGRTTADDLEPLVLNLLRRGFLEDRPLLLARAQAAAWLEDRAVAVGRHLDQLDEALAVRRGGYLPMIAQLELAGVEPDPFSEPYRWSRARPMRRSEIEAERVLWEKRLVMTQEDAIAARLRLQGEIQREREAVRLLSRSALGFLDSAERALRESHR